MFLLALVAFSVAHASVVLELSHVASADKAGDELAMQATLYNPDATRTLFVWKPNTPFETPIVSDVFDVRMPNSTVPAPYIGMLAKRTLDSSDVGNYVVLGPRQRAVSSVFNLASLYDLEPNETYVVSARLAVLYHREQEANLGARFTVGKYTNVPVSVQAPAEKYVPLYLRQHPNVLAPARLGTVPQAAGACDMTLLNQVFTYAIQGANRAASYLNSGTCSNFEPFRTWFSSTSVSSFWGTVRARYNKVSSFMTSAAIHADCSFTGCGANVYAFVYPSDPSYTIHFCSVFWSAPNTLQPDSKPGTIIHEVSHFYNCIGNGDYAYGQIGCKNLAYNNPGMAIVNADNYEYFAEFSPSC